MEFRELEEKVLEWAQDRGILDKATPLAQGKKTLEEVEELLEALHHQSIKADTYTNSKGILVKTHEEVQDALGDIFVTIIIGAKLQGLDLIDCLGSAYDIIAKRTGVMKNGVFVKDV